MSDRPTRVKRYAASVSQLDRMFEQEDTKAEGAGDSLDVEEDVLTEEVAEVEREFDN